MRKASIGARAFILLLVLAEFVFSAQSGQVQKGKQGTKTQMDVYA